MHAKEEKKEKKPREEFRFKTNHRSSLNDLIRKRLVRGGIQRHPRPRGESGCIRWCQVSVAVLVSGTGFWSADGGPRLKWKQMKLDVMRSCGEGEPVL